MKKIAKQRTTAATVTTTTAVAVADYSGTIKMTIKEHAPITHPEQFYHCTQGLWYVCVCKIGMGYITQPPESHIFLQNFMHINV